MGFESYQTSMAMRDVIARMVEERIQAMRPEYRYATVTGIDRAARKCSVRHTGAPADVLVNMGSIQPRNVGQTVRIEGIGSDKFIADVMGQPYIEGSVTESVQITDWNNAVYPGFYFGGTDAVNSPVSGGVYSGVVTSNKTTGSDQIVQELRSPGAERISWVRRRSRGVWTSWAPEGGLPQSLRNFPDASTTVDWAASSWGWIPGSDYVTFGALPAALEVVCHFSAIITVTGTSYGMIGVRTQGGLVIDATDDQSSGSQFRSAPFSNNTANTPVSGVKRLVIPAGSPTTTFRLQSRRNGTSGVTSVNYSKLEVVPVRWV